MAVGGKAVSKRSTRIYVEDGMEKDTSEYQSKKMNMNEETVPDGPTKRKNSVSTATSQSTQTSRQTSRQASVELSPLIYAEKTDQLLDDISPESLEAGGRQGYPEAVQVFGSVQAHSAFTTPGPYEILPAAGRPINFGVVVPGVYRSSFPQAGDYDFVEALKLKTVVTLVQKDFPQGYDTFISKNGIRHYVFGMKGTKKEEIPIRTMKSILRLVLDRQNHPLLIHCNHGRHRTGCVVAVVRKVSGWNLRNIIDEYKNYAGPKIRDCDVKYIAGFELADISNLFRDVSWQFRTRNFLRVTIFTIFVLLIWLLSGNKIADVPKRKLSKS
ncbi:tyrosine phosphatase family-domain-containing protein [Lasiosphaeria hispida]|uniref:diphosphoinositol-polyphosphate diphosphatase n=1 Tax=Lasiosphaeria hispida TaxID=260671 RepID=A0AAJ0M9W2_9PEZI|nr:tyrosine phosphatase family-domain-containing protein [Lasiosphaeria hispida]